MPVDVIMPALGMAQDFGKVVRWLKADGDEVAAGEPLLEIETDKVTVQIEAGGSGVLGGVSAAEGDDVPVGTVIALIYAPSETPAAEPPGPAPQAPRELDRRRVRATPKARRIAAERGVDLAALAGTGPGGAVQADDVLAAAPGEPVPAPEPAAGPSRVWLRMAERLSESWREVPHFFLQRDVDATRLLEWKEIWRRKGVEGVSLTDLLVSVSGRVLSRHPRLRSSWVGGDVVVHERIDVGLAVAIEDGLLVPVVRDAHAAPIERIAAARRELVERARGGRLGPEDVQGGVFTISNLGMFGVDSFRAIVNPPQAAILAVGRTRPVVRIVQGIAVERPTMSLTLSCDHRVVDGARAAAFLSELAETLEDPLTLLD